MGDVRYGTIGGWGGRYPFHRPYVRGFATNWPAGSIDDGSDEFWILRLTTVAPGWAKWMHFKPAFYNWTSNGYTADWIFEDFYITDPFLARYPAEPFNLGLRRKPGTLELYYALDVGFWSDWFYKDFPPCPTRWPVNIP